jgi:hypothetical protein
MGDEVYLQSCINNGQPIAPGNYGASTRLIVPTKRSLLGLGVTVTALSGFSDPCMVSVPGINERGLCQGMFLDGAGIVPKGWDIEVAVGRRFEMLYAHNFTDAGMVARGAQNNSFLDIDLQYNATNLRLNWGAGNNKFSRFESNASTLHGVVFAQDAALDANPGSGFNNGPQGNLFEKFVIERPTASQQLIAALAGSRNTFRSGDLQVSAGGAAFWAKGSSLYTFDDVTISGDSTTTVLHLEGHYKFRWLSSFPENHAKLFELDDASSIHMGGVSQISANAGQYCVPLGTKTQAQLITGTAG